MPQAWNRDRTGLERVNKQLFMGPFNIMNASILEPVPLIGGLLVLSTSSLPGHVPAQMSASIADFSSLERVRFGDWEDSSSRTA